MMTGAEVRELWDATDEDLHAEDEHGLITLWARLTDSWFRFAPSTSDRSSDKR